MSANDSPSVALARRMIRSFPGRSMAFIHSSTARSTRLSLSSSASLTSNCSRGPVPIMSLARVDSMPARYELLAAS